MGSIYRPKYKDAQGNKRQSGIFWIQYYSHGRRIRESTECTDFSDAKEKLRQREGEATKGPVFVTSRKITFNELAQDLENEYTANGRKSLRDLKTRLRLHILPEFGSLRAVRISTADINRYVVKRKEEGATNAGINRELAAIKRAFSLAIQAGKIAAKPYIPMLKENNVRKGFFERHQLASVLKHLKEYNRAPAIFAFLTGWRKGEYLNLQWRHVDFEAETVCLDPGTTKNDAARTFSFKYIPELCALLMNQKLKADLLKEDGIISPWVFFHEARGRLRGKRIGDPKRNWGTACRKAGLPGMMLHDFRRTAVRNLERSGVPRSIGMKLTGHKTESVYRRYDIVSKSDLDEASKKLGEYLEQGQTAKVSAKVAVFSEKG
ncbi:MAG: tyrosine-type recombinase/integrase [Acidobacteria bacterium]|nr:tyrosine-type recombinase/integrase [Acidobacteriota bacterium]